MQIMRKRMKPELLQPKWTGRWTPATGAVLGWNSGAEVAGSCFAAGAGDFPIVHANLKERVRCLIGRQSGKDEKHYWGMAGMKESSDHPCFDSKEQVGSSGQLGVSVLNCGTSLIPWMWMEHDSVTCDIWIVFPEAGGSNNFVTECRPGL